MTAKENNKNVRWCKEENDKLGLDPKVIKAGSHQKAWFVCKECKNKWQMSVSDIVLRGKGCPKCMKQLPPEDRFDI